ncbi:MAG: hypothetical protein PHR47_01085 [Candidatus Pacebacteria bacterium]|nr:hypothetical protein [Candidatus Paceibacterota bacterium]
MANKINIDFFIDEKQVIFFAKVFEIDKKDIIKDAYSNLVNIKNLWFENEDSIERIFEKVFNCVSDRKIKVFIFPDYFYLGAAEVKNRVILFGQLSRTKYFPLAIITHEIGHIFLSKFKLNEQFVNEVICLMIEDYVYSLFDSKSLSDIWKESELDSFHSIAIKIALDEIKSNGPIVNRDIDEVLESLLKKLPDNMLSIKPSKGLISNIIKFKDKTVID